MPSNALQDDPIGIGIGLPFSFRNGRLALTAQNRVLISSDAGYSSENSGAVSVLVATDEEKRKVAVQAMKRVILTQQGSRFMEGDFGSLMGLVPFEPNDEVTHDLMVYYAVDAIQAQVDRVEVLEARAIPSAELGEEGIIKGVIAYRIRETSVLGNAVVFEKE